MDRLRIPLIGRKNAQGHDYYVSTCKVPCSIDLSETVILVFPEENPDNDSEFWADLVIRKHDIKGGHKIRMPKRRRGRPSPDLVVDNTGDEDEEVDIDNS